jgi:hypothetical protein
VFTAVSLIVHRSRFPVVVSSEYASPGELAEEIPKVRSFPFLCQISPPTNPTGSFGTGNSPPVPVSSMLLLVSLTRERAIYLALELDRTWTEMVGVNPYDGTISRVKSASLHVTITQITAFGALTTLTRASEPDSVIYSDS